MKKVFKRTLATFLTVIMLFSALPLAGIDFATKARAEDYLALTGQCGDNVYWNFDSSTGTLTISGIGKMYDYEYDHGSPFYYNCEIKKVIIQDGVTSIGDCVFERCVNLKTIIIAESVERIEYGAFCYCYNLKEITIPYNVNYIGVMAFYECHGLETITIPDGITVIDSSTFGLCTSLANISIPKSVMNIYYDAFYYCYSLKNVYYSGDKSQWNRINIEFDNEELTSATIHYNSSEGFEKNGMRIIVNNNNLSYFVGESILISVCDIRNGEENCPKNVSVKISDSGVLKLVGIMNCSELPPVFSIIDEIKNSKFIVLKAISSGSASVLITNNDTGESRVMPINVSKDEYADLRVDKLPTQTYKALLEEDKYNFYSDKIWVSDMEYREEYDGWHFSMNLYNENYCCGVIEVYDSKGKLISVRNIDKYESLTKGLYKCVKAGYYIVEDMFKGDSLSFRSDVTAKCTKIEDLVVPQDGHVRITANSRISYCCAVNNAFDMMLTTWNLADDIKGIVSGVSSFSTDDFKAVKAKVFAKMLVQREYVDFSQKFQKKIIDKCLEGLSLNMVNMFSSSLVLDCEEFLEDMGLTLEELLKSAVSASISIAESLFEDCLGPFGLTLKALFTYQDANDLINQVNDLTERMSDKMPLGFYTPIKGTPRSVLKNERVTVDTLGNAEPETVLESYCIMKGDAYIVELNTGEYLNEYQMYEIALVCDGEIVQPKGKVKVYIESPYETAVVARQNADGSWSSIDSKMENGMVVFEVDHFCKFVISEKQIDKVNSVSISNIDVNYKSFAKIVPQISVGDGVKYTVKYESSNPSVAVVDKDGNISTVHKGSTTITCTVTDEYDNVVKDICTVIVKFQWWQWLIWILLFGFLWY